MARRKICEECGFLKMIHGKGLCKTCYSKKRWKEKGKHERKKKFDENPKLLQKNREYSRKYWIEKKHRMPYEDYKKLTKKCVICNFSKIVELHHLNKNPKDNKRENLVGLCPNHHKLIHNEFFKKDTQKELCTKLNLS